MSNFRDKFINLFNKITHWYDYSFKHYSFQRNWAQQAVMGWENDLHSPIVFADGGYLMRGRAGKWKLHRIHMIFNMKDVEKIDWSMKEGYLPCFISEYTYQGLKHKIENFSDKVTIDGKDYVIVYTAMTSTNISDGDKTLPKVKTQKIIYGGFHWHKENPLVHKDEKIHAIFGDYPTTIKRGQSITRYYAVAADKWGDYPYPSKEQIIAAGGHGEHYEHMKAFWNNKLSVLTTLDIPDNSLLNAYKAGYIYTMMIKNNDRLFTGEMNYENFCGHDWIGISMGLQEMNDKDFVKHAEKLVDVGQYYDSKWKHSLPFAYYLMKSNDYVTLIKYFDNIKSSIRQIEFERDQSGIMKLSNDIDADGFWLIDEWSVFTGLTAYSYICDRLYKHTKDKKYADEKHWSDQLYNAIFEATEKTLKDTFARENINYLPVSPIQSNDKNRCRVGNDANWAAHFLFGRWAWEGYLFGAEMKGVQYDLIDATYKYGLDRLAELKLPFGTFGGYPGVSSGYNAGYGAAALSGEEYRDIGIKAYQYMIRETQSAPNAWWEMANSYKVKNILNRKAPTDVWGSCPNTWCVMNCNKVLINSLIAEKADGTIIIGRGIPNEWLISGNHIEVKNYPTGKGNISYRLEAKENEITIEIKGNEESPVSLELILMKNNIKESLNQYDLVKGKVLLKAGVSEASIMLNAGAKI